MGFGGKSIYVDTLCRFIIGDRIETIMFKLYVFVVLYVQGNKKDVIELSG